jgi:hypothetical protein
METMTADADVDLLSLVGAEGGDGSAPGQAATFGAGKLRKV